jgi:outer membrane protein assembly factor BamB
MTIKMRRLIAVGLAIASPVAAMASDAWPQFRGPDGAAISHSAGLPDSINVDENLRWKAELPGRGVSCPVVFNGKIFLTANSGMDMTRLHALALDQATGKKLWERTFWSTGQTLCHPKTCMACPTMTVDAAGVYAAFATGDLVGLSHDGDVRWVRSISSEFPKMANHVGRSSSLVLGGGVLGVLMENQGESYLFGIDPATGETKWKAARPLQNNWNTPLVQLRGGGYEFVVSSYTDVAGYDAATGKIRWSFEEKQLNPIVSPVAAGEMLIISAFRGMFAIKPSGEKAETAWKGNQLSADTPTPVVANGKIYTISRSVLKCGNLVDGKQEWDLRVPGPSSASPVFVDDKLYLVSEDGKVTVVKTGTEPTIVAKCELKETILATPAIADGAIFFRSDKHLWCFGNKKAG